MHGCIVNAKIPKNPSGSIRWKRVDKKYIGPKISHLKLNLYYSVYFTKYAENKATTKIMVIFPKVGFLRSGMRQ